MSHTPGPLTANIIATRDGMYSIRDAQGERVGLAFTRDDALLWSQAPALLAACHSAASCLIAIQAGTGPAPDIKATLATLRAAIASATKS